MIFVGTVFITEGVLRFVTLKVDTMKYVTKEGFFMLLFRLTGYDKPAFMLLEYIFCLVLHAF